MTTKKRAATSKSKKASVKRSAGKKSAAKSRVAVKSMSRGGAGMLTKGSKKKASSPQGAYSTAPVVYQTLREKVAAVEKNIGQKQTLREFLDSVGWK